MSFEQIGQKLKAAREVQGLSLRQIHDRTKIPIGHLQSIDGGQAEDLPEPVYVSGFIKRYADCVGLDGQSLADEYRQQVDSSPDNGHVWGKQLLAQPMIVNPEYISRMKIDSGRPTFKTIYFNALWIIIVVGLVSYLTMTQVNNQANQQDPNLSSLKEAAARYQTSPVTPLPATPAVNATTASNAASPSTDTKLSLNASSHVWVEVKSADTGESLFTGYMEQGDRRDFQDTQGLRIRVGNGGSVTVDYQGKLETFGQPGVVAERVFAAKSSTVATDANKDSKPASAAATAAATHPATVATAPKRIIKRPSDDSRLAAQRESHYRHLDDVPSRQYIPGEALGGGTRSIDVPYRYTEGRLDAE